MNLLQAFLDGAIAGDGGGRVVMPREGGEPFRIRGRELPS